MKVLFTGATGLLGRYCIEDQNRSRAHSILAVSRSEHPEIQWSELAQVVSARFEEREKFSEIFRAFRPDVVVHAGGEGNVDAVEKDPEKFRLINLDFPQFLMEEAASIRAKWIHFSSNAVYDGLSAPYAESALAHPLSLYGKFKAEIDSETRKYPYDWMIFRPTVSYGWNFNFGRKNPVTFFLPLLQARQPLKMVKDQFENPVYAGDVAKTLWCALDKSFVGELNVGGGNPEISRYDWMLEVARAYAIESPPIESVPLSFYANSLVARPKNTSFDTSRLKRDLGVYPLDVFAGALAMKEDLERKWF
jgi:dTDP-4-dehydrorhamnose reductase